MKKAFVLIPCVSSAPPWQMKAKKPIAPNSFFHGMDIELGKL